MTLIHKPCLWATHRSFLVTQKVDNVRIFVQLLMEINWERLQAE